MRVLSWSFNASIRSLLHLDLESVLFLVKVVNWYANWFAQSPSEEMNTQVCFQFKPKGPGAFETTLLCIVNNHSTDPRTLTMKAEAYEPNITILGDSFHSSLPSGVITDSKSSSLAFRPTVVGRSSTRMATLKNNTGIAISYKWQFPEQLKEKSFTLGQISGVLSPWETKKQVFEFSPRNEGNHDTRHAPRTQNKSTSTLSLLVCVV